MKDYFNPALSVSELNHLSTLALAHIGDAVYELLVRSWLCSHGRVTSNALHGESVKRVSAKAQAAAGGRLLPILMEAETAVYRRGRNTHATVPQSADPAQYRAATGLETLFGWLYLSGEHARINELFLIAMEDHSHVT